MNKKNPDLPSTFPPFLGNQTQQRRKRKHKTQPERKDRKLAAINVEVNDKPKRRSGDVGNGDKDSDLKKPRENGKAEEVKMPKHCDSCPFPSLRSDLSMSS
ncbi:hypothetical protein SLE2022_109290 [Rubroshorea leprosula]